MAPSTGPATPAGALELEKEEKLGFAPPHNPPHNHARQANLGGGEVQYIRTDVGAIAVALTGEAGRGLMLACTPVSLGDAVRATAAAAGKTEMSATSPGLVLERVCGDQSTKDPLGMYENRLFAR